jgi:acyl-CoA thioesterase superfamily protein/acyl-Coa thioesterase superfamily protein
MGRVADAFFLPDGDGWRATSHTRGPWSPEHQHGGPPAALIAHVIEAAAAPELFVARLTVDFLRPVPIDRLRVRVEPLRTGAKVQRLIGLLLHAETVVAHAVVTLIRREAVSVKPVSGATALPPPEMSRPFQFPFFREPDGYHTAMETRLARGEFGTGRVAAWMRQRVPVVPEAPPSPLERVLVAADSGSGVSAAIDHRRQSAINADLTLALFRSLEGDWVGLDSVSIYEANGVGLADTRIFDARQVGAPGVLRYDPGAHPPHRALSGGVECSPDPLRVDQGSRRHHQEGAPASCSLT